MNIVVIMRYFDALNDENAMYIEFERHAYEEACNLFRKETV